MVRSLLLYPIAPPARRSIFISLSHRVATENIPSRSHRHEMHFPPRIRFTAAIRRLKSNDNMETKTLNKLCIALECKLEDIAEFVEEE